MIKITDSKINKSYSILSIEILELIILIALLFVSYAIMMVVIIILVQYRCTGIPTIDECIGDVYVRVAYGFINA